MSKQSQPHFAAQPLLAALLLSVSSGAVLAAQDLVNQPGAQLTQPRPGLPAILTPASGQIKPGHFHTNLKIVDPGHAIPAGVAAQVGPPKPGTLRETPASLACIYGLAAQTNGCNPNSVTALPSGGSRAIAVVDAFNYPTAEADLNVFIGQFGLAAANFQVVYANPAAAPYKTCPAARSGTAPTNSTNGWDVESALDVQMAHSIAPSAKIYLVEAMSSSFTDMFNAEAVATACVQAAGGGQVSNSWGAPEIASESSYDSNFTGAGVLYLASAGDNAGVEYPAASPNVLSVGGTTISRDQATGAYQSQVAWNDWAYGWGTGGGPSVYEALPSYQQPLSTLIGAYRGTPDLAAVADPLNGVWIYNSWSQTGWLSVGGTSAAAPFVAGVVNRAGFFYAASFNGVNNIYTLGLNGKLEGTYATDINNGVCGPAGAAGGLGNGYNPQYIEYTYKTPWDWCTGWGVPRGGHNTGAF